jgi:acyl-CoA synthetase (NDP forming)
MVRRDLTPFFAPKSVAVVGAGERATSSGGAVLQNLRISQYQGEIIPVNPKGGDIFGIAARRSLRELNHPADLVVIVIRPDLINDAVREAAATGHRHILVLPGGFAEAGPEGLARDAELRAIVDERGLTLAGPNCAGLIHLAKSAPFAATFLRDMPPGPNAHGAIAFVTQSGALGEEMIAEAHVMRLPIGTVVSVGNSLQIGIEDHLEHLGDDPTISSVFLYIESFEDPARFRAIARGVAARKPVVALIGGRTEAGARAAAAHTGAVPNGDAALAAFCADCGVLRVDSLRRLLLAAKAFGAFPQGIGRRVLILSNSGGPGVVCTDRAASEGLDLVVLPAAMAATLRAAFPGEASVANPLDLLADAREDRFGLTLESAIGDGAGAFDAILGIHVVPFMVDADPVVGRLAALAPQAGIPMMHSMMGTLPQKEGWFARLEAAGILAFNDVEAMATCAGLLARYPALRAHARRAPDTAIPVRGRSPSQDR